MAENNVNINKSDILYELLVLSEWIEDYDSVISKNSLNSSVQDSKFFLNPWKLFRNLNNLRFLQTEYSWHLAVSKDGKVVAILQETLLEIKTAKDEYSSVVGKACIPTDQNPKLRKVSWSPDNSFLAVARDNGVILIFNLFGCNVATVEPATSRNEILQPVAGLCFLQPKFKSTKWSNELLVVYHHGDVKSVLLSSIDGQDSDENIKFSFSSYYPAGISAIAYDPNHLLIVAGTPSKDESYLHGITVWRILNDYPFLKSAVDLEESYRSIRSFWKFLPGLPNHRNPNIIIRMSISSNSKLLACIHLSGEISLWRMPSAVLFKKWSLHEQPQYNKFNPEKNENLAVQQTFHPVDIGWWSDNALVIVRQNGALSVCSIENLENLLGDSPEFLAEFPQICCIEEGHSGVIVLECETACLSKSHLLAESKNNETSVLQESIQAALYSFTDIERFEPKRKAPKVIQRIYRMIAVKKTTPEELYTRKIDNEEYEDALLLARKYNLDCDLVYQKRWRNSNACKNSIHNYLEKIHKILWVVNECVERVPDALEDAKELLKFGLSKSNLKDSYNELNIDASQLVVHRVQLLKFLDSLTIYEKIIGSPTKYNSVDYGHFRKQPAIVATVNFARQGNWQAVSIMFTYMGNEVLPHWLPILSNFPETLKPLQYRSLLPEVVDNEVIPWETQKWRNMDWSEKSSFSSLNSGEKNADDILYKNYEHLKKFQAESITVDIVQDWYKKRIYEIEENTGLVDHALSFVVLARERGIKLNILHNNLKTLETMVYLVGDDNITLQKLEKLNHSEQAKLLLSKTDKNSFINDLKNLLFPFSKRCKEENCHTAYSLLRDILLYFSEESLELPYELLNYLKEGYLNPLNLSLNETASIVLDCIYACSKSDQLETYFLILECLPQRSNRLSKEDAELHDRIDKVEVYLEICELLENYDIQKSVRFIQENENNESIGKELMNCMADYTKRNVLDFTELLSNLLYLRSKIFLTISENFCYELCCVTQMTSECEEIIQSAEDLLECRKGKEKKKLPFERSVELVLEAARSHFEKATNFDDHYIQLAQTCLKLIHEPHMQICEELDLIEAVQLLGDFKVNVLPLQVRKHDHRMDFVEECLKAKPSNYKSCQRLLQLAETLRIYGEDKSKREGEVLMKIAEYALKYSDYQYCSDICNRLITRNFSPAWIIIKQLAEKKEYDNKTKKQLLLAFGISHCPIEHIEGLIEYRVELREKYFEEHVTFGVS